MPVSIPELEGYFGGKGGSGVYQNIINLIPPHNYLIVPFLGHCGIVRNILPAKGTVCSDVDPFVIDSWEKTYYADRFFRNNLLPGREHKVDDIDFYNDPWEVTLGGIRDLSDSMIYLDPPYPRSTRKSDHRYTYEMTDEEHQHLLVTILGFSRCNIMISTYDNTIYKSMLKGWYKKSFRAQTRNGTAVETVYYNYPPPVRLHDYRYFGNNFKQREHYKLKKERLISRFKRMSPVEQGFYLQALAQDIAPLKTGMPPEYEDAGRKLLPAVAS